MIRALGQSLILLVAACGADVPIDVATSGTGTSTGDATTLPTSGSTSGASTTGEVSTGEVSTGDDSPTMVRPDLPVCGEEVYVPLVVTPPNVALVVERSGSMVAAANFWDHDADDPDGDGETEQMTPATPKQSRWRSLSQAVAATVTAHDHQVNFGLGLFPADTATAAHDETACTTKTALDVPLKPMNAGELVATLPKPDDTSLAGASPATRGVKAALADLQAVAGIGLKYVVLISDGSPNCRAGAADETALLETYDDELPVVIADALKQNIPTIVVGVAAENVKTEVVVDSEPDGVRPYAMLQMAAIAGGATVKPWLHDAQDQLQLEAALEAIAARTICSFALDVGSPYISSMELVIGGTNYGGRQSDECEDHDGWRLVEKEKATVELCNQACADFVAGADIVARLRCPND